MSQWIDSEHHVSISGQTGAGKTYLANEIHGSVGKSEQRLSIFLNTQHEQYIDGYTVRSIADIRRRLSEGTSRYGLAFNYLPRSTTGEPEHAALTKMLLQNETPALLVTDEAHEIAGSRGTDTSLHRAVKRGRRWNVKNLVVSQRPASVSNDVLSQCKFHVWVGGLPDFDEGYLETYSFPMDKIRANEGTRRFVVKHGGTATVYQPV